MGRYTKSGEAIEGRRIICEFEQRVLIHSKEDYTEASIKGNLAKAVVVRTWQIKS